MNKTTCDKCGGECREREFRAAKLKDKVVVLCLSCLDKVLDDLGIIEKEK